MAQSHDLVITVKKDGSIEYTVKGMKGRGCRDVTKFLDELGKVTATKDTSEAYGTPVVMVNSTKVGGGN